MDEPKSESQRDCRNPDSFARETKNQVFQPVETAQAPATKSRFSAGPVRAVLIHSPACPDTAQLSRDLSVPEGTPQEPPAYKHLLLRGPQDKGSSLPAVFPLCCLLTRSTELYFLVA